LVIRRDDPRDSLAAFAGAPFAFNDRMSQSGYAAPLVMAEAPGIRLGPGRVSGAHRASARMVAEGQADIAALDAVSWRHMTMFDDWSTTLRVLDWTEPTPGLPFITVRRDLAQRIGAALARAIAALDVEHAGRLTLRGIVPIAEDDYLAVPDPGICLAANG
ncbi:MAG: PhnD/SsuA/transferrin family substrate-binding protein, partial [Rubellimicrobium sp.]|nr:PhnD/SsuA/transferrin family substrate-binding protein [Rubellimicrobium sp.]